MSQANANPPRQRPGTPRRLRSSRPQVESLEGRQLLSTFTVRNANDAGPDSLRDAIERANLDPDHDTIEFAQGMSGSIDLASALPDLSTDIDLLGPGASTLTVRRNPETGTPEFRIFRVAEKGRVAISGLTISGGQAEEGGGIFNAGSLAIADAVISGNRAWAINKLSTSTHGGGISNTGTLSVARTVIEKNAAIEGYYGSAVGGGIQNSGTLTLTDSTVIGNSAPGSGGGISNSGTLVVSGATIRDNYAAGVYAPLRKTSGRGGGISNSGTATILRSAIVGNSTLGFLPLDRGGGIVTSGTMVLANSTVGGNTSANGSGIDNTGALTVADSTIAGNSARLDDLNVGGVLLNSGSDSRVTIGGSIVAASDGGSLVNDGGAVVSLGHNLFNDRPAISLDPSDLAETDPKLGPLADNGGPTPTHALLPGSPAINANVMIPGVDTDQRGVSRPQGPAPDIGAFEADSTGPIVTGLRRFGVHAQPTRLELSFSAPLDQARANNRRNYRLMAPGRDRQIGTADDRAIPIASAQYDDPGQTVTLRTRRPLPLPLSYQLTVVGTPPGGLTDTTGQYLAGIDVPGTDYVTTFGREVLVRRGRSGVVPRVSHRLRPS